MIEIVPAVLPQSFEELERALGKVRKLATCVQIDVVDGHFAPNTTWPYTPGGEEMLELLISQNLGLPFSEEFDFELDLMVASAKGVGKRWIEVGAVRLIFHAASEGTEEELRELQALRGEGDGRVSLGVALPAHGSVEDLKAFEGLYDFVQVMGIDNPGFQGQPPDPHGKVLELIAALRNKNQKISINVDGGVNKETAPALVRTGANRLIAGSAIFAAEDPKKALEELVHIANHAE